MFAIEGPSLRTCQGISRRELLQAGGLGVFGLTLPDLLRGEAHAAGDKKSRSKTFGCAKSCLIVFLNGGASHHDTFDMKPDAPEEIRGEFKSIASNVPGIRVCEHLPQLARQVDKFSVVRSLSHQDFNHPSGVYWMVTGHPYHKGIGSGLSEHISREDHPHIGSALTAVEGKRDKAAPPFVTVPDYIAVNGPIRAGQHGGFLGSRFDPMVPRGNPNDADYQPWDLGLVPTVSAERLRERRALLAAVNEPASLKGNSAGRSLDQFYEKAFGVLASGITQRAFDMSSEPAKMRERYGRNLFGQSVLLGRRLVEAGVRLVHVNWIRILEQGWDTHNDNFNALKKKLLPPADQAIAALFDDMNASGLLKETLVLVMGEFGRSPKVTPQTAGREHWPSVFTILMAGAGIPGGRHYGSSDKIGAYPLDHRILPGELAATIYHALGIDSTSKVKTMLERPWQICEDKPVLSLWG
ncbi:MAG TPA: DUF1501 domain-containing protein [Gemmataceae bacterium]|nr:DUF1501 domain-containing protein [Gemmataceae bacterium]